MKDFGLIVVDKPVGPTSHRVVNLVRRGTGLTKVGHAGTLDPRASGVLVLCLGAATRLSEYLSTSSKSYEAVIRFGSSTQTYDSDGQVTRKTNLAPDLDQIRSHLANFVGEIEQVPPPFSAIKIKGRKAYELARKGQEPELGPRRVIIHRLEVLSYKSPDLTVQLDCSAGTYVRSLAHDLGERAGTGAFLAALRRTRAGPFTLDDAVPLSRLEAAFMGGRWEDFLRPAADALPQLEIVRVREEDLERIRFGHAIPSEGETQGMARGLGPDGRLVAILEAVPGSREWHPRKVFLD
jgi:tRNA pseudouridine55 synthase